MTDGERDGAEGRALDHIVLPFGSLGEARRFFAALGFTVAPDAVHPFGTGNACVFFADGTYLEPLAIADPSAYEAAKAAGNLFVARDAAFRSRQELPAISALAFRSADAIRDRNSLARQEIAENNLVEFSRNFRTPAGEEASVSFRLAFARAEPDLDVSFFFCQPLHAKAPDRSTLMRHANGVTGIARIVLAASAPDISRGWLQAVTNARATTCGEAETRFALANSALHLHSDVSLTSEYGIEERASGGLRLRGIVLRVADMAVTRASLATNGQSSEMTGDRLVVPLGGDGSFIAFEESPA